MSYTAEDVLEISVPAKRYDAQEIADAIVYNNTWFDIGDWESATEKRLADAYIDLMYDICQFKYDPKLSGNENRIELLSLIRDKIGADIHSMAEEEIRGTPYNGLTID